MSTIFHDPDLAGLISFVEKDEMSPKDALNQVLIQWGEAVHGSVVAPDIRDATLWHLFGVCAGKSAIQNWPVIVKGIIALIKVFA